MNRLLNLSFDANFYLYRKPVKMSRSFDGLASLIRTELDKGIIHGDVFIFLNRQRSTIKVFVCENKGFSIFKEDSMTVHSSFLLLLEMISLLR